MITRHIPADIGFSPRLGKRAPGSGPVTYPYGQAYVNEFLYEGWDPSDKR